MGSSQARTYIQLSFDSHLIAFRPSFWRREIVFRGSKLFSGLGGINGGGSKLFRGLGGVNGGGRSSVNAVYILKET